MAGSAIHTLPFKRRGFVHRSVGVAINVALFHCAILQAKALEVTAQAQAQADLYTQEQKVRSVSIHMLMDLVGSALF